MIYQVGMLMAGVINKDMLKWPLSQLRYRPLPSGDPESGLVLLGKPDASATCSMMRLLCTQYPSTPQLHIFSISLG